MAVSALEPFVPSASQPWNRKRAAHLLRRAGFAPTKAEIDRVEKEGLVATVDRLLSTEPDSPAFRDALAAEKVMISTGDTGAARTGWFMRMIAADNPLREKLTLFWHGHFATSNAKVNNLDLMIDMIGRLRAGALGPFPVLLAAMTRDPAMIIWLDNNTNRKGHANENYSREIMELFSLGVGNYTETDIREAGRAFTGWHTDGKRYTFNATQFDDGRKTVFGKTGNFGGDDIVKLCCDNAACARFIAGKLFRFFVHEKPTDALIEELAVGFRRDGLHVGKLMRTLLLSREFHSDRAYRANIKSPVEFTVGAVRSLNARVGAAAAAKAAAEMGQSLLEPPTVKGWDGGRLWLNSQTVLVRTHFIQDMCLPGKLGDGLATAELIKTHKLDRAGDAIAFLLDVVLQNDVPDAVRARLVEYAGGLSAEVDGEKLRGLAQLVLSLPENQLN